MLPPRRTSPPPKLRQRSIRVWFGKPVHKAWSLTLGLIALAEFTYDFLPKLTIDLSPRMSDTNPLLAEFQVNNTGHWSVHDVTFSCVITALPYLEDVGIAGFSDQHPVKTLMPDRHATRGCSVSAISGLPPDIPATIDFVVTYHWPIIGYTDTASQHFVTHYDQVTHELHLEADTEH